MIVNIRGPEAMRFRVEVEASATLLELSARIAAMLGSQCPPSGFQISMNKCEPLEGYLSSLSDLGVRPFDRLYLLVGMTGCGDLFISMSEALAAARPPVTAAASTQTATRCTTTNCTQTLYQSVDTEKQAIMHKGPEKALASSSPELSSSLCDQESVDDGPESQDSTQSEYDCSALLPTQRDWLDEDQENEVADQDYEECDRKQRDGIESGSEGSHLLSCEGTSDDCGETVFLASHTQTQQTPEFQPPAASKFRSMTPPLDVPVDNNVRKRLRSNQQRSR